MHFQISIHHLRLHAHHGVMPQERAVGADFLVSIQAEVEVQPSAWHDDRLEGTTDYAALVAIARREMSQPSQLLEHAAARIASAVLNECPSVSEVCVELVKENPPLGVSCQGAGVKIRQTR